MHSEEAANVLIQLVKRKSHQTSITASLQSVAFIHVFTCTIFLLLSLSTWPSILVCSDIKGATDCHVAPAVSSWRPTYTIYVLLYLLDTSFYIFSKWMKCSFSSDKTNAQFKFFIEFSVKTENVWLEYMLLFYDNIY